MNQRTPRVGLAVLATSLFLARSHVVAGPANEEPIFRAGAAVVDITPEELPVLVVGGFLSRTANQITDRLYARCLVMDNGSTRVALTVVDSCVLPADLLDETKRQATKVTKIPSERMMISATHTHTAPATMGGLGTDADPKYPAFLIPRLVEVMRLAEQRLAPARAGSTAVADFEHTHCRRWVLRPNCIGTDPFGSRTVRAMMHPGYQSPRHVGPAGPVDPCLTLLAIQSLKGKPIALLANYSQHYYGGVKAISADYYGRFVQRIGQMVAGDDPQFVAMMSQGTSGDLHWMDYSQPAKPRDIDAYADAVAQVAYGAYQKIKYQEQPSLAMCQRIITLKRRVPDEARLAWARKVLAEMPNPTPRNRTEVYAREQVYLHEDPVRPMKLQALRVGELGITAIASEVYGITGLKIKLQSPLVPTMNIELANGEEGYIPPPEQHALGGYTTWPARSAALQVEAEPTIVASLLEMLEEVAGCPRRPITMGKGRYVQAVLASKPTSYWRLAEIAGVEAADVMSRHLGSYEPGVAFFLDGVPSTAFCSKDQRHRAAHFAGGRMQASVPELGNSYSVEMWFWNGLPADVRAVTGYLFSRGADGDKGAPGDHLGIGGTHEKGLAGKLFFYNGDTLAQTAVGNQEIGLRTWNHVVLVREGDRVAIYLNGQATPDVVGTAAPGYPSGTSAVFVGGRSDNLFNFEGKIAEVAVYARKLSPDEISEHYAAAGIH